MAPRPYEIKHVEIQSRIAGKRKDRYKQGAKPELHVKVTNNNTRELRVIVEVTSKSSGILVNEDATWFSDERVHGGKRSQGKRGRTYKAPLNFVEKGDEQELQVKVYACGLGPDRTPKPLDDGRAHLVWVT